MTSIQQTIAHFIMDAEARERGYYERVDVQAKVRKKLEEIMVTSLYGEVVTIDEKVTMEDIDAYWAENSDRFRTPETRSGRLIIAASEAEAVAARQEIVDGRLWREVVQQYGTDNANKSRSGKFDNVNEWATGSVAEALFSLPEGELSQAFDAGDGRYAIVRCDRILPGKPGDKGSLYEQIGQSIKSRRKEDLFLSLLADWEIEFGVTRYDENLESLKSWRELTYEEAPGAPVERH